MSGKQELDAVERARTMLRTKGAEAAVRALIAVCDDPKAPAPAKATAGTSIIRAIGFFDRARDDGTLKEPHEMTADELRDYQRRLERERRSRSGDDEDVFD